MVTRDSDMNQLLTIDNLIIFNHLTKELQECKNPSDYLQIKILSGDTSDSIPGILMPDKKKKLGPAGATTFFESLNGKNCFDVAKENGWLEQYIRNRRLIDLSMIPDDIKNDITKSLDEQVPEFCPFWELQGMDIPQRLIEEIAKMKNVGYYCLNNKEEIAKSPDFFKAGSREVKDYTKQEESKILNRIGDSGEYGNLFGIGGVF
jgi:5'-3' exonuclease